MILVDAVYINQGGGKILLEYFIKTLMKKGVLHDFYFLLDERLNSVFLDKIGENNYLKIAGSERNRKVFYKGSELNFTKIFCFGNVPPPINLSHKKVYILFHNAHLVNSSIRKYGLLAKLKYSLKKYYIQFKNHQSYTWLVQTNFVKGLLEERLLKKNQKVMVLPFFSLADFSGELLKPEGEAKYLYVADGQPQKKHDYLFKVWEKLYHDHGLAPELFLTIGNVSEQLEIQLKTLKEQGLRIQNLGYQSPVQIGKLYSVCEYLVYPSEIESFGLPLIEAASAGCKVIAIDQPYVFEVIKPSAVFNLHDVESLKHLLYEIDSGRKLPSTELAIRDEMETLVQMLRK